MGEEEVEEDRNLQKMTELATAYFDDDDTQSDRFYPISGISGRGVRSQFYPARGMDRPTSAIYDVPNLTRKWPPAVPPKEPSSVKCQKSCSKGLTKTCLSLYIGFSGISLSLIGLTAYAIVQIPSIRRSLGPYYVNFTNTQSSNITGSDFGSNYELFYGLEVAHVTICFLIGITVNLLLVYGAMAKRRTFLLPWLVVHALLILILVIAFIVVIVLVQPIENRWFGLAPLLSGLYLIFAWINVFLYYAAMKKYQWQRNLIIQSQLR